MASSLALKSLISWQLQKRLPLTSSLAVSTGNALSPFFTCRPPAVSHRRGLQATWNQQRFFFTDDKDVKDDTASSVVPYSPVNTLPVDVDYDVEEIMRSFGDTSYYDAIARPDYSHMTNEELKDTSTIPGWELICSPPKDKDTIPRGALVGKVVSTKMMKTVNVEVNRYRIHPKYRKRLRYTKKFMAHDEKEVASMGDLVMISPCQRISRHKHFMLREIIKAKGQM